MRNPFRYEEFTFLPGMWRAYRPEEFDVTVTCSFPFVSWALRAKRSKGRRPAHVFVTQNGDWAPQRRNSEFGSFSCEGLVCTNPEYFERHAAKWNAVLIPNGVDLQRFRPGTPDRESFGLSAEFTVALVVSSLTPNKRVLEAVRALAPDPHLHLVVAGRGHLKEELLALGAREMGARFHHLEVSSDRMGDLYRAADVLLHMSRTEPFGNIYPEALATGLPIVADDNETTRWIVEDEGRLVDTRKPAAVLAAVRAALDDGDVTAAARRRQLAERRFAWPAIADQYFAFLLSVALTKGTAELAAAPESDRDAPTPTTGSLR